MAPKGETRRVELPRVGNEELLKQAQLVLDKANSTYLAQLRELATIQLAQEAARKEATAPLPPEELPNPEAVAPLDVARDWLERTRRRLELHKKRLERTLVEKALADRVVGSVDACASAALAFSNVLDDLGAFGVEIDLRVKDRTLPGDAVPKALEREALRQRKQELATEQERWKQQGQAEQAQLAAVNQRVATVRKNVLEAESRVNEATRRYAQEQKQQEVEKEYTGRPAGDLQVALEQMQEEEAGLKGSLNLALRRFKLAESEEAQRSQALTDLKPPPTKPTTGRPEDMETSVKNAEANLAYLRKRSEALAAGQAALHRVIDAGSAVEGEITLVSDQLARMQMVADLLKAASKDAPVPKRFLGEGLAVEIKELNAQGTAIQLTVEKARTRLSELEKTSSDTQTTLVEADKRLHDLRQTQEASRRLLEFEKTLKGRSGKEILADFTAMAKTLEEKSQTLATEREGFGKAQATLTELRKKQATLKDPFLRLAEAESLAEKQKILDELKKYAGLDRGMRNGMMTEMGKDGAPTMMAVPTMIAPVEPKKEADKGKEKEKDKESEKPATVSLQGFQQLLATRVGISDDQEELKKQLLKALESTEKAGESYSQALTEVRTLTLQQYAAAVDLKKRLGRGEVESGAIPEGVTQVLKREELGKLDASAVALVDTLTELRGDEEKLRQPDKVSQASHALLKEALAMATQRLDLLADLKRLEKEAARDAKEMSPAEVKRIEQVASERQSRDGSWVERFVSIDSSPAARSLVEVLQTYYREVVGLEEKQELLRQQKGKADKLIDLAQQETALLEKARPLLREHIADLERQREEETLLVRARLKPEEADQLLKTYQTKSGKLLPRPRAIPEKDRAAAVQEANGGLFERLLEVEAARRWEALLEARLSPGGLPAEMGAYQDQLGVLAAGYGTNTRRLVALTGQLPAEQVFPTSIKAPERTADSEIGSARADLFKTRRSGVVTILIKVLAVLLAAWFLPGFLTWLFQRAVSRSDGTARARVADARLVMAFLGAFLKLIVYTIALVLILSILGFDITAILAGLGIGGLAIGLASQHAIADMLGGIIIFLERPFSIGDVIKIKGTEPAKVRGLTWRLTILEMADGTLMNMPNREITDSTIQNLTRGGKTLDSIRVSVSSGMPIEQVVVLISEALKGCKLISQADQNGVTVEEVKITNKEQLVTYSPFWYVSDFNQRDVARDEVLTTISKRLREAGTEVAPTGEGTLSPAVVPVRV
jgi:small-conductance mechanosensitive channel